MPAGGRGGSRFQTSKAIAPYKAMPNEKERDLCRIASNPFAAAGNKFPSVAPEKSRWPNQRLNNSRCERERRGITPRRILLETFQTNRREIAIDLGIPEMRMARLGFENQPDRFPSRPAGKRPDDR